MDFSFEFLTVWAYRRHFGFALMQVGFGTRGGYLFEIGRAAGRWSLHLFWIRILPR